MQPIIRVPAPSELRMPRPFAEVMEETRRMARADDTLTSFLGVPSMMNPRYSPALRAANERRRQEAAERRSRMAQPVARTPSGRISRARYATPEARRAGALIRRRANAAAREASSLSRVVIPISEDVEETPRRRQVLSDAERLNRRRVAEARRAA